MYQQIKNKKKVLRNIELILLAIMFIVSIFHIAIGNAVYILATQPIVWGLLTICIMRFRDYPIKNKKGDPHPIFFIWSVWTKMMCLMFTIFYVCKYPMLMPITILATVSVISYIIVCLYKKAYNEALMAFFYKIA